MLRMARTASRCTCGSLSFKKLAQLGERLAAAELPQQIDRGPTHGGIGRALEPLDLASPARPKRHEHGRQTLARARLALFEERFGKHRDHRVAKREKHSLHALERRVFNGGQMSSHVAHHRPGDERVDGAGGCLTMCRAAPPLAGQDSDETIGRLEIADQHQIVDERHDGSHQRGPLDLVVCDPQQIAHERKVELAQLARRDRTEPSQHALGRIVADLFDVYRCLTSATELASVLVGDKRLVRIGRQQRLRQGLPLRLKPVRIGSGDGR